MENEVILKEISKEKDDYMVVQRGNIIESINRLKQVFHYIDLSYIKNDVIIHGWVGYRTTDQLKAVLDGHFMDIYKKYKCKNAIVESTKMSGSFEEANMWLATSFMPKLVKLGLKNVAVIVPENIFAQLSVETWDKNVAGFDSKNFTTLNSALDWLRKA